MKKQTKLGLVLAAAAVISVSVASLVSAKGWVQQGADWFYVDNDGEAITDTIQSSGNAKFYLGADDGSMQKDFFLEDKDGQSYYFGSNGAMVTNTWVAIESSRVDNQGDYVPDNYWYYFQASGKAMKGTQGNPKKTTIDGKKYMFNENGQMLTGWINGSGEIIDPDEENPFVEAVYFAGGDNDGVLRAGWVTYYDGYDGDDDSYLTDKTNLYFYFNPSNNTMTGKDKSGSSTPKTKKINGKTYAFDGNGVMLSGWDVTDDENARGIDSLKGKTVYFSGEDDGHQVKKGWVYTVPASNIDTDAYDDGEEKYLYFNSNGAAVTNQMKKINGKYYVFNLDGIMQTGLVIWDNTGYTGTNTKGETVSNAHYLNKLDLDWANGDDVKKKGILQVDSNKFITVTPTGELIKEYTNKNEYGLDDLKLFNEVATSDYKSGKITGRMLKLHLFGEDGARKTGTNLVEFADDTFSVCTNAQGDKGSGSFSKKYYALGIVLKASADIKYGIYVNETASQFTSQAESYRTNLTNGKYQVLTTSGSLQKGNNQSKKDADGNYWMIEKSNNVLTGIWSVSIKKQEQVFNFAREVIGVKDDGTVLKTGDYNWSEMKDLYLTGTDGKQVKDLIADNTGGYKLHYTKSGNNNYGTIKTTNKVGGYWFQSDYDGSSNKWVPFGVYDDSNKTCNKTYGKGDYQITPTDDYFLNCYWD